LQELMQTFGISILLQLITELHIHDVGRYRAVALWACGVIHDVTVTSSLHHQPWLV